LIHKEKVFRKAEIFRIKERLKLKRKNYFYGFFVMVGEQ